MAAETVIGCQDGGQIRSKNGLEFPQELAATLRDFERRLARIIRPVSNFYRAHRRGIFSHVVGTPVRMLPMVGKREFPICTTIPTLLREFRDAKNPQGLPGISLHIVAGKSRAHGSPGLIDPARTCGMRRSFRKGERGP